MTISLAAGFPTQSSTFTIANKGDLIILKVIGNTSSAVISSISSSKIQWQSGADTTITSATATHIEIWPGISTGTGSDTITINWSVGSTSEFVIEEWHDSVPDGVWARSTTSSTSDSGATTTVSTGPITTSADTYIHQVYTGHCWTQNAFTGVNNTPAGFTYNPNPTTGGHCNAYAANLPVSTSESGQGTQASGHFVGEAVLYSYTPPRTQAAVARITRTFTVTQQSVARIAANPHIFTRSISEPYNVPDSSTTPKMVSAVGTPNPAVITSPWKASNPAYLNAVQLQQSTALRYAGTQAGGGFCFEGKVRFDSIAALGTTTYFVLKSRMWYLSVTFYQVSESYGSKTYAGQAQYLATVTCAMFNNVGTPITIGTVASVELNQLYDFALDYDGVTGRFFWGRYSQGTAQPAGSSAISVASDVDNLLNIGSWAGDNHLPASPNFNGTFEEVRYSNVSRHAGSGAPPYPVPSSPFVADANTVLLLHMDSIAGKLVDSAVNTNPGAKLRNISDAEAGADSLSRAVRLTRSVSDPTNGADTVTSHGRNQFKAGTDATGGVDATTRFNGDPRSIFDFTTGSLGSGKFGTGFFGGGSSGSDVATENVVLFRASTDTAPTIDSTGQLNTRSATDGTGGVDLVSSRSIAVNRPIVEASSGIDTVIRVGAKPRSGADATNATDALTSVGPRQRLVTETLTMSDVAIAHAVSAHNATENTNGSDITTRQTLIPRADAVATPTGENVVRSFTQPRLSPDASGGVDVVTARISLHKTVTDATSGADTVSLAHFTLNISDITHGSDSVARSFIQARSLSDLGNGADVVTARISLHKTIADATHGSDGVTAGRLRVVSDATNGSDAVTRVVLLHHPIVDVAAANDQFPGRALARFRTTAETTSLTDAAVSKHGVIRFLTETTDGSDSVVTSPQHFHRAISDNAPLSDIAFRGAAPHIFSLTEATAGTDSLTRAPRNIQRPLHEVTRGRESIHRVAKPTIADVPLNIYGERQDGVFYTLIDRKGWIDEPTFGRIRAAYRAPKSSFRLNQEIFTFSFDLNVLYDRYQSLSEKFDIHFTALEEGGDIPSVTDKDFNPVANFGTDPLAHRIQRLKDRLLHLEKGV